MGNDGRLKALATRRDTSLLQESYLPAVLLDKQFNTVDSKKLEHGCRLIFSGVLPSLAWELEDGHVPTFWLLLYSHPGVDRL